LYGHQVLWSANELALLHSMEMSQPNLMEELLQVFQAPFAEPQGLPLSRSRTHRIRSLPDTESVVVRLYRYGQKAELEQHYDTMLQQGVIGPSCSAFSVPVLLVKKADNSGQFCVNYRALNVQMVKDKFPIPVVEELLDELRGTTFFTKLDLHSGYHRVRMHPKDMEKRAFRMDQGLFEFLVMPFGLSNALTMFQALMNEVLHPFLRKPVLVFFDDILIYSAAWSEHLQQVCQIVIVLCSKCATGLRTYEGAHSWFARITTISSSCSIKNWQPSHGTNGQANCWDLTSVWNTSQAQPMLS
jgi:hypothetical protein